MFNVPDSAWLISRSVDRRRDSRAWTAAGSAVRVLAIRLSTGADGFVFRNGDRLEERHQFTQPRTHLLDRVRALDLPLVLEPLAASRVLVDPSARVLPAADLFEHFLHFFLGVGRHQARSARVVAVFGRVA